MLLHEEVVVSGEEQKVLDRKVDKVNKREKLTLVKKKKRNKVDIVNLPVKCVCMCFSSCFLEPVQGVCHLLAMIDHIFYLTKIILIHG